MPPKFSKGANKTERVGLLDDYESDEDFFLNGPSTASDKVGIHLILHLFCKSNYVYNYYMYYCTSILKKFPIASCLTS